MKTMRLNLDALKVSSFATSRDVVVRTVAAPTDLCGSAVSATNGVAICKSCGPCCS